MIIPLRRSGFRARAVQAGVLGCLVCGVTAPGAAAATVARWHMDETSGTVMNDATRDHDGSFAGHSVELGRSGFLNKAYGFNGSTSYVSVPSAADLNPRSANIDITVHLRASTVPSSGGLDVIRKGVFTTSGGEWKMEYYPSGQASCGFNGSSHYGELTVGPRLNDGAWHTVHCVKTSGTIKVIVDGRTFSKSVTVGSISNSSPVVLGSRPGAEYFRGTLDEVSVQIG
jgi:hypothetical protein